MKQIWLLSKRLLLIGWVLLDASMPILMMALALIGLIAQRADLIAFACFIELLRQDHETKKERDTVIEFLLREHAAKKSTDVDA